MACSTFQVKPLSPIFANLEFLYHLFSKEPKRELGFRTQLSTVRTGISSMSQEKKFAKRYKKQQIESASPGQLIVLLYEGAIDYLNRAQEALKAQRTPKAIETYHNNLIACQNIITELTVSLDMDRGGEIAKNLFRLYDFMYRNLVSANVQKNQQNIQDVKEMLVQLKEAWVQVVEKESKKQSSQRNTPSQSLDLQG